MKLISLERDRTHTLLGVRFWDRLTNQVVTDGLRVVAQRLTGDRLRRLGKPIFGRSLPNGVIAFFGLTDAEMPAEGTPDLWDRDHLPPPQLVAVDVVDRRGQFLPMSFVAQLPFRGAFQGVGDWLGTPLLRPESLDDQALGVQLWSDPRRSPRSGFAMIRAQLVIGESDTPAAYALVRVRLNPPSSGTFNYFGMADGQGNLALPIPYPQVPPPADADNFTYPTLDQQLFPLRITVQYSANPEFLPNSEVPNLETLLTQPQVNIGWRWVGDDPPILQSRANLNANLQFERPLILRTALGQGAAAEQESVLRLLPN